MIMRAAQTAQRQRRELLGPGEIRGRFFINLLGPWTALETPHAAKRLSGVP